MRDNILEIASRGFTFYNNFVETSYIDLLSSAIDKSYEVCRSIQITNDVHQVTDGTVHHLLLTGNPIYLDLLEKIAKSELGKFIETYFQGKYILNGYGGVINLPEKSSYVSTMHRDIRFFSNGNPFMLNMLIMLDDFTLENGATHLLEGSHKLESKPTQEIFNEQAARAIGGKGDILFFDSNLWHAAGVNKSLNKRRAITITFTKPFMKQQLDYCKAIGYELVVNMSEELKQILGFFSRTPTNLEEWYKKPEERFYRAGQD
jgi:hypothetical protein